VLADRDIRGTEQRTSDRKKDTKGGGYNYDSIFDSTSIRLRFDRRSTPNSTVLYDSSRLRPTCSELLHCSRNK